MLQQEKKQLQIYFRLYRTLQALARQSQASVDNTKKPSRNRRLKEPQHQLKKAWATPENIFQAVQKTTTAIVKIYRENLCPGKHPSEIPWFPSSESHN